LLDIDPVFLKENNIEQVFLSTLSFKDYLSTLATARTFTYMVGAGVFNLLFLGDDVEVLEINPHRNNSWAEMFGLSRLCRFNVIVSNNLKPSSAAAQDELILDSHVYFDRKIADAIQDLVSRHN
jgi:capsular polysaccharide biosynthesis protein